MLHTSVTDARCQARLNLLKFISWHQRRSAHKQREFMLVASGWIQLSEQPMHSMYAYAVMHLGLQGTS